MSKLSRGKHALCKTIDFFFVYPLEHVSRSLRWFLGLFLSKKSLFIVLWKDSQLLFQETRPWIQTIIILNVTFCDLLQGSPKYFLSHYSWPQHTASRSIEIAIRGLK